MARTPFTLAALSTAAVPGLEVVATREHTTGEHGDYDAAIMQVADGRELIIRVPRTQAAETEQAADLIALGAMTGGIRSRLPFELPTALGQAPFDGSRAVVYDFLPGRPLELDRVHGEIAVSAGQAVAAIHSLPTGFVLDAGLPQQSADDAQRAVLSVIDRAQATGSLPAALRARWNQAAADESLWQFVPTVINGALSADSLLVDEAAVRAVIGWSALSIGDPARDLAWVMGAQPEAAEAVFSWYEMGRQASTDPRLQHRALLHAELDLARWLLHGHELHDQAIIADAEAMLDTLVERVHQNGVDPLEQATVPVLDAAQVEELLSERPVHSDGLAPIDENVDSQRSSSSDDE
ncbi:phosphotransferase [Gryllotalpicola protaetiae]|uniref:Macrolide 2'-phosphotransferase n=1 Tax=Gryllotalpicola protaetiae TaxID=2419771 RepID=A0A387BNF0_9MICO|nr:phosphotransferase [Gryllotalpicola protaetiae]AYG02526.1 macrolide 2'-phosphotransferase [Gryllotalpicola protaetiae]